MDIPFARKVLEFAEQNHDDFRYNQSIWYNPNYTTYSGEIAIDTSGEQTAMLQSTWCGTSACLAGIACILSPEATINPERMTVTVNNGQPTRFDQAAKELIGLTEDQAFSIFHVCNEDLALQRLRDAITEAETL